jgi:hypothetical protein
MKEFEKQHIQCHRTIITNSQAYVSIFLAVTTTDDIPDRNIQHFSTKSTTQTLQPICNMFCIPTVMSALNHSRVSVFEQQVPTYYG